MILIRVVETNTYYDNFFVKWNNYSYKLKYDKYLELVYRCLSNYMYIKTIRMRISYGEITCVYGKSHVIVV
jgi:hypothetical protein